METQEMGEDSFTTEIHEKKKRKKIPSMSFKKKKKLSTEPTAEELSNLQEAETMFQSNFFKLQVDELLKGIRQKVSEKNKLKKYVKMLKSFISNLPESDSNLIKDFKVPGEVKVPILMSPANVKGCFQFVPPTKFKEIGSFMSDTVCSSSPLFDIAVEIPKACWQGMDYLNYRYHRKRALYLAYIASFIHQAEFVEEVTFTYQGDCYMKPVLLIKLKHIQNIQICLLAYPKSEAFKPNRFSHSKNNVRSAWFCGDSYDVEQPTPYYNASVLSDLLLPDLNEYLIEQISSQNLKDGIVLLKLWCMQRDLCKGYGRVNGFLLSMFVLYLLMEGKIDHSMNAYQVFRCALLAFSSDDLVKNGISLCNTKPVMEGAFDIVFLDQTGLFNMCYAVSKQTCLRLQHESKLSLEVLNRNSADSCHFLFLSKINFCNKFEYLIHFKMPKNFSQYIEKLGLSKKSLNFGENRTVFLFPKICDVLTEGLNNRISLLDVSQQSFPQWSLTESPPTPVSVFVTIGVILNPDVPLNNVEKGPPADSSEAAAFRSFWGEKCELRRFKDGSIREAVYWSATTVADKRKAFHTMVLDILKRHLDAEQSHLVVNGTEVDCALQQHMSSGGTGEEAFVSLMQSFNSLSKQLRGLEGLPLLIASIQGVSPAFRNTEVFLPLPVRGEIPPKQYNVNRGCYWFKPVSVAVPFYVPQMTVVVSFEGSGKWPNNVEAIQRVKAAFLIRIAELVKSKCSLTAVPFLTHTDIVKDGYVFRIEIACHKEIYLLKQVKTANGALKIQENKESRNLEIATEVLPKLNSVLHGLCQQHPTYGTSCRLAKRWVSAHLNFDFIHEITIELLVAFVYLHPEPFSSPSSPQTAFIRFLNLLTVHDFEASPVIVNLNNEMSAEFIETSQSTFLSQRSSLPAVVIITPYDARGNMWTKNMPSAMILKRLLILACASLQTLTEILSNSKVLDVKSIFRPPLNSFDVLIYLKRSELPRLSCAVDLYKDDQLPDPIPYKQEDVIYPIVGYNPVENYLKELKENFGEFAFFLHDIYGGDYIAVIWKKKAFTLKEFKQSSVNCRKLCGDSDKIIPDVERILEDFEVLGSGIVKEIVKQTQNWKIL